MDHMPLCQFVVNWYRGLRYGPIGAVSLLYYLQDMEPNQELNQRVTDGKGYVTSTFVTGHKINSKEIFFIICTVNTENDVTLWNKPDFRTCIFLVSYAVLKIFFNFKLTCLYYCHTVWLLNTKYRCSRGKNVIKANLYSKEATFYLEKYIQNPLKFVLGKMFCANFNILPILCIILYGMSGIAMVVQYL